MAVRPELNEAAQRGDIPAVSRMLANESNADTLQFAAYFACQEAQPATAKLVFERLAELRLPIPTTCIVAALEHMDDAGGGSGFELIQNFVAAGGDLNQPTDGDGGPPLFKAIARERLAVVRLLLDSGADPNHVTPDGEAPIDLLKSHAEFQRSREATIVETRTVVAELQKEYPWMDPEEHVASALRRHDLIDLVRARTDQARLEAAHAARNAEREAAVALVRQALGPSHRATYRPMTERGEGKPDDSRFGGLPYLATDEPWPSCGDCGGALTFFAQVALDAVPDASLEGQDALLQLFYCIECAPYEAFAEAQLVRLVGPRLQNEPVVAPSGIRVFEPHVVIAWQREDDYPHPEEGAEQWSDIYGAFDAREEKAAFALNRQRDKVRGWPSWVQRGGHGERGYPCCRVCAAEMTTLLLQLDSQDHVDHVWGDNGVGFVFQCPAHASEVTFLWEST